MDVAEDLDSSVSLVMKKLPRHGLIYRVVYKNPVNI